MKNLNLLMVFSSLIILSSTCKNSNSSNAEVSLNDATLDAKVLTENLSQPWELVWGPDDKLWMTERGGKISRVDPATGQATLLLSVGDVKSTGEGGLLGMALHPDFNANPQVFVAYTYDKSGTYTEKIVRYTFNGTTLTNPVLLLDNIAAFGIHNGCRLLVSSDQKLFITTGDASNQSSPQNLSSLNGKVLRINFDGSIPADNPNAKSVVWSVGHRNAQGLVFANGKLYSSEHGPNNDDEINIILKGRNYGWPNVMGVCNQSDEKAFCDENNVVEPIYKWTPTLAVCGLDYYNNDLIPQWKNSLLLATLKDNTLYQLKLNAAGDKIEEVKGFFKSTYGRLRDVCVAPNGKVYLATSNGSNDKIIVIDPQK